MNYLAIFVLVIVVIFLLQKKQVKEYKEEKVSKEVVQKVKYVKENITCICTKNMSNENITNMIRNMDTEYVLLTKKSSIGKEEQNIILYNFVIHSEAPCGFNVEYYFEKSGSRFKDIMLGLVSACVNYIQMLSKEDAYTYFFVCIKKEDALTPKVKVQSFELSQDLSCEVSTLNIKEFVLRKNKLKLGSILNIFFVIVAGTLVTTNVIYNLNMVLARRSGIGSVLACALIYVCYANILKNVYSALGKFRFIASYLFPIYIVVYVLVLTYYYIRKVVGEVCVNKKKSFLVSLIILLIVYLVFILLK